MSDYLLGLLTVPAVLAIGYGLYIAGYLAVRGFQDWWTAPRNLDDWNDRAVHASCVFAANRVWALKLPGSRLLVFRSNVGWNGNTSVGDLERQERARDILLDEFDPR
ncbi:hypothetical protein GS534_00950 [Rhodococcus hoagii]|nr:hypothetical protein [Prescottella equi]